MISTTERATILNKWGGRIPTAPVYLALLTQAPALDGTTTGEVVGNGYQRQLVGFSPPGGVASPPSTRMTNNLNEITFPIPTAAWGTITHIALSFAASGGVLHVGAALDTPLIVAAGTVVSFPGFSIKFAILAEQV